MAAPGGSVTSISENKDTTVSFTVDAENFSKGDGLYRIGMYAQSALDYSWDVSYILLTVTGDVFLPSDATSFDVLTTKMIT